KRQSMMHRRGDGARKQAVKCSMPCGAFPEHAEQKCGEERRVHKGEYELQKIHDVVEASSGVCGANRKRNAEYGRELAHSEVVPVRCALMYVRLIDVVGPDGVEGGD